jgi:hypothetical protein
VFEHLVDEVEVDRRGADAPPFQSARDADRERGFPARYGAADDDREPE